MALYHTDWRRQTHPKTEVMMGKPRVLDNVRMVSAAPFMAPFSEAET
jgi:hypothetical protein